MKYILTVLACLCGWFSAAQATLLTASFQGTVSAIDGSTGRVQLGDPIFGVLRFDPGVPTSGWRIRSDDARFIWWAWEYPGPPPVQPLPMFIGMQNLRNGERFEVPRPSVPYDESGVSPAATIDFDTVGANQVLEFGVGMGYGGGGATLHLGGDGDAFYDTFDMGPGMINSIGGDVVLQRSFARYVLGLPQLGGFNFDVALTDFRFGPIDQALPEPAGLALAALGLTALACARRRGGNNGRHGVVARSCRIHGLAATVRTRAGRLAELPA